MSHRHGQQLDMFDGGLQATSSVPREPNIPGLHYVSGFLSLEEQHQVLCDIDDARWDTDLARRVQHYGWRYDYRSRVVSREMRLGAFPKWLESLATKVLDARLIDEMPDQAIVNEYLPGQGIAMHIDRQCFGPVVATVSLGDAWRMDLRPLRAPSNEMKHLMLVPGSILTLAGEARSRWMHGIAPRKREHENGGWRLRQRRVSVTFRTVSV